MPVTQNDIFKAWKCTCLCLRRQENDGHSSEDMGEN